MADLNHLYEFDEDQHEAAYAHAIRFLSPEQGSIVEDAAGHRDLARAFLKLTQQRGVPPTLKCNPTITLVSGRWFDYLNPDSTPLLPTEIAAGLSKVNRYGGHTLGDHGYTVAQHSVLAAREAPKGFKFEALMHDAVEVVMGDCMTPLKQLLPDFKRIEQNCEHSLRALYRLPLDLSPEVKVVDLRMACTEKRDLMPKSAPDDEWGMLRGIEPYEFPIEAWDAPIAQQRWLTTYCRLWSEPRASCPHPSLGDYISPRVFDGRKALTTGQAETLREIARWKPPLETESM